MKHVGFLLFLGLALAAGAWAGEAPDQERRAAAEKAMKAGNFKDAYEAFRQLVLDAKSDPLSVGKDLTNAIACLNSLGRTSEYDDVREKALGVHGKNWRFLLAAAQSLNNDQHFGFMIAGKFSRGHQRGGGQYVNCQERDHVRAVQLLAQALAPVRQEADKAAAGGFYLEFATMLLASGGRESWRLQYLTELKDLPDYEPGWNRSGGENRGAPVGAGGLPLFYSTPKSFETAMSDGERWRWCLLQTMEVAPSLASKARLQFAGFLRQQFDVCSLAQYGRYFRGADDEGKEQENAYSFRTLGEDETIARLATGVKRFKLPDEFNFIKVYRQLANEFKGQDPAAQSLEALAQVFEDRQQYPKAAECWKRCLDENGDHNGIRQGRLNQIVGNWGQFEQVSMQPAGTPATVEYRFRNGRKVSFVAQEINIPKLLDDVKAFIRSKPKQLQWEKMDITNIGWRLVQKNETQYLGAQAGAWAVELNPRPDHFDRRATIKTPLEKSGAYLLTATLDGGNTSRVVIWVADTAIVEKQLDKAGYCFVADAVTGKPIAGATVEFFGYQQNWVNNGPQIDVQELTLNSDANGQVKPAAEQRQNAMQWLITAKTAEGRFAHYGFSWRGYGQYQEQKYDLAKDFVITDRPAYRPDQPVKFKCWVNRAQYEAEGKSQFAGQSFTVQITNPKGDKVLEKQFTADDYGGFNGELNLPKDATLGAYHIQVVKYWPGATFRVEEYKKPEFEVKVDAPTEPVMLGEKVTATISAKYYFGAPVTEAKVKYKVLRHDYSANWYPASRWDWFYAPGYWWFASDYPWYPGWQRWGCKRPYPWWWHAPQAQPELVMENETAIGADGSLKVEIDSALARALHADTDHKYEITAEVTDQSRRTIVGSGNVMVARQPFKVYAWVDRGHYRVGDAVQADFSAQTLDNKPVKGKGQLKLLKITYDKDGKAVETPVQEWTLDCDEQGKSHLQIKANEAGQYRLNYAVTDAKNHSLEGGYLFCVIGEGFDGSGFRFNNLELVTDKREYKPGDKVSLMINTNRKGSTVVLFARPANGVYLAPKIISLAGKSVIEELEVAKMDMPNFFIEAFTISDGKLYSETREIIVPPESRVLDVAVTPSKTEYKPGEKGKVQVKLTDATGEPYSGSTVLTVYDKSLEYIFGGSNVPEIKSHFWKWRRSHYPRSNTNLSASSANVQKQNEITMQFLGAFGYLVADQGEMDQKPGMTGGFGGGKGGGPGGRALEMNRLRGAANGAPAAAAPQMAEKAAADGMFLGEAKRKSATDKAEGMDEPGAGPGQTAVEPTVRKNFADAAYWVAVLTTSANGLAEVEVPMPENLTTWRVKVWAMGQGARVGQGEADVTTTKNLIVRLQAPRFFTEKDEVVLSANVHNYLKTKKDVKVELELEGGCLEAPAEAKRAIAVDAKGEQRVDWRVKVLAAGEPKIRVRALTDEESDAMEMKFPAYVHGMLKTDSVAGAMRPDKNAAQFAFNVPAARRAADSRLEVRYSPTLAGAMVDALPYLVDYPYGCTEQTLSRFLPTVLAQRVLMKMNVDLKEVQQKITNLNAQEIGDDVKRAAQWKRYSRNPVFDEAEVANMVKSGVDRLVGMQCGDGGWGWFSGYGEHSYPHTTAYVVHGLDLARKNGVSVNPSVIERGIQWLKGKQEQQLAMLRNAPTKTQPWKDKADNLDAFVYMVLSDVNQDNKEMREALYRDRNNLAVYSKAMFGLALKKQNDAEKLNMVMQNIDQFLVQDDENQTAYLKLPQDNYWWYWYGSEYEAQAYYLKLLSAADPKSEKASRLVKYLINNRKNATYWNSTRDTAVCVEALADYLGASGEDAPDMKLEILLDGKKAKDVAINPSNLFTFDNKLVLAGGQLTAGEHKVEFRKEGKGPLYFNSYMTNFTLEEHLTKSGLEIKVERKYYKLKRVDKSEKVQGAQGQALDQKVEKYEREELKDLDKLKSGDLVEIELGIASKNDYEYIIFEDMKAAGFEPVEVRSGYAGNSLGAYMELRDERVVFFVRALPRGNSSVSYRMRAEIPGKFSALPTKASAMYAPELKANSEEIKLQITD